MLLPSLPFLAKITYSGYGDDLSATHEVGWSTAVRWFNEGKMCDLSCFLFKLKVINFDRIISWVNTADDIAVISIFNFVFEILHDKIEILYDIDFNLTI